MTIDEFWNHIRATRCRDSEEHADRLVARLARLTREDIVDFCYWWGRMHAEAWAPPAGAGEPRAVLSRRRKKMAAARSRGNAASTCPVVKVPARKAATKASSRIGATAGMPAILVIPPKSASPVQEAEGLPASQQTSVSGSVSLEVAARGIGVEIAARATEKAMGL
jgi:hypothetical protein